MCRKLDAAMSIRFQEMRVPGRLDHPVSGEFHAGNLNVIMVRGWVRACVGGWVGGWMRGGEKHVAGVIAAWCGHMMYGAPFAEDTRAGAS